MTRLPLLIAALLASAPARAEQRWTAEGLLNRGTAPIALGALPPGMRSASFAECEDCHLAEAAEWRGSLHRRSWTQPLFQEAYRLEPMPECRNCHQPLTAGQKESAAVRALRSEGVTCAVCHVRDGQILSARRSGRAPHPVSAAPVLGEPALCGGCHQFPFPERRGDGQVHLTSEPMQDTLGEWQRLSAGDAGARTCQDCHMPWVPGAQGRPRRSHRFLGGYDPATLRQAIAVTPEVHQGQAGPELRLGLLAQRAGHAVPTGDLYRSIVVTVEALGPGGRLLGAAEQRLQRRFRTAVEPDETGALRPRRRQAEDDRLVPGQEQVLRFPLPAGATAVRFRLHLRRLPPGGGAGGASVSLISEGQLPLQQKGETS